MADHLRPMEELLRVPTKGIEDAIVVPAILVDEFEFKIELLVFISVLPSNTAMNPHAEFIMITTMDGLTLDGSFIPHSKFLGYQEEEQEPETIMEVVKIPSSQSTPLVSPPETPPFSGINTSHFDHSIPNYEAFFFDVDRQKEKSSGSTTSHSDPSLSKYESFYFVVDLKEFEDFLYYDPSIDPPLIAKRSDSCHEEFTDELAHIISPPKKDYFYFDIKADPEELISL
ncbi:hypothetical protein Tco_0429647 [Tanacetum coccineum]